MIARKEAPN